MKKILSIFITFFILLLSFSNTGLFFNSTNALLNPIFNTNNDVNPYKQNCVGGDCLKAGVNSVKDIEAIETEKTASEYIQDIVKYLLTFLAIIAILLIIYAGFNLMTGAGDEEKAKKTKGIIIYAVGGLIIIFLAGPIANFIFELLNR